VLFDLVDGFAKSRASNPMAANAGNKIRNAKLVRFLIPSIQSQLFIESPGLDLIAASIWLILAISWEWSRSYIFPESS
jgi:hypothetical protein